MGKVNSEALNSIFLEARTYSAWSEQEVPNTLLKEVYDLAKMGPTSANCCPMRIIFVKSKEAKARLKPCLAEGNVEKTMQAPVTAIIAYDLEFYELLPTLYPHADARSWFKGNDRFIKETAFRNSSLQGAYFILAARSLGLDCGPMSGFNKETLDKEFFPDGKMQANFLCNLGYGLKSSLYPRNPRPDFATACKIQ